MFKAFFDPRKINTTNPLNIQVERADGQICVIVLCGQRTVFFMEPNGLLSLDNMASEQDIPELLHDALVRMTPQEIVSKKIAC